MNKNAGFSDLFIFMIMAFIIILMSGVFIYIGSTVSDELHEKMDGMDLNDTDGNNASMVIDNTIGRFNQAVQGLYWLSILIIGGMIVAIFIGSYLVTTKPVFLIPYIFVVIIAIIVSVAISNAYETVINDPTLASTFANFLGANWIMLYLPLWISIIGITGGIIMFTQAGRRETNFYSGY